MASGVRIHHWGKSILHAKATVIDDSWAMVGSYNLNPWSFRRNREVVVNVLDGSFTGQLAARIEADIAESVAVTPDGWRRRSLWRRELEWLAYQLWRRL